MKQQTSLNVCEELSSTSDGPFTFYRSEWITVDLNMVLLGFSVLADWPSCEYGLRQVT